MRLAAIYGIHGNLPALEAALEDIGQADVLNTNYPQAKNFAKRHSSTRVRLNRRDRKRPAQSYKQTTGS